MSQRVAFFTIGESPRDDVVPEMRRQLGAHVQVDEFGALDGLDEAARRALAPRPGVHHFVTRLRDGGSIELHKAAIESRLAELMHRVDGLGYALLVPLCTGTALPRLQSLVVEPQQLVDQTLAALARHARRVGIVLPLAAQLQTFELAEPLRCDWRLSHASPYEPDPQALADALQRAGRELTDSDFIVMHCMGYSEAMRQTLAHAAGRPTLLSNRIVAQTLAQLLA